MTENARPTGGSRWRRVAGALGRAIIAAPAAAVELLVSQRVLALAFLGGAAVLAASPWLIPPLGFEISGFAIPLGIPGSELSPEAPFDRPPKLALDNGATLVMGAIALGAMLVVIRPRWLPLAAGLLLAVSFASLAATALNHPAAVELLDVEAQQRRHVVSVVTNWDAESSANRANSRVQVGWTPLMERAHLTRGWAYLHLAIWLVPWAALGVVFGGDGGLPRRIGRLALWSLVGLLLAGGFCQRRLRAEYHWHLAQTRAAEGNDSEARSELTKAIDLFPEFAELERTWYFEGKLDYLEDTPSDRADFFVAHQLYENGEPEQGLDRLLMVAEHDAAPRAVRMQAADMLIEQGLSRYDRLHFAAAETAWNRAHQLAPLRFDAAILLGSLYARTEATRPERAAEMIEPVVPRLADKALRADLLSTLGDAYFQAGEFATARRWYTASLAAFNLPKQINYRGRRGLMGM